MTHVAIFRSILNDFMIPDHYSSSPILLPCIISECSLLMSLMSWALSIALSKSLLCRQDCFTQSKAIFISFYFIFIHWLPLIVLAGAGSIALCIQGDYCVIRGHSPWDMRGWQCTTVQYLQQYVQYSGAGSEARFVGLWSGSLSSA